MKAYTNIKRIEQKQKLGVIFSLVGFLIVMASLFFSFQPESPLAGWGLLLTLLGFVVALVGTYHLNRWVRPPLPEIVIDEVLERLDSRYLLFHHFPLLPVPHLLLTPKGLVALVVKRFEGEVFYEAEGDRWRTPLSLGRLARIYFKGLTSEGLGRPGEEGQQAQEAVRAWLQVHLPELADEIPVAGLLLFLSPQATLHGTEASPLLVTQPPALYKALQGLLDPLPTLPKPQYKRLRDTLEARMAEAGFQPVPSRRKKRS